MRDSRRTTGAISKSIAVGIGGIAALFANACGSDSKSTESSGCEAWATRECVGPSACKGGQVCGPDGNWLACDCGGTGGNSGSGATGGGGSGAAGGSGGVGASGGMGGTSATGGTGANTSGGSGGASGAWDASTDQDVADATDSGVGPYDDPCPADPINVNCSTSCGAKSNCGPCSYYTGTPNPGQALGNKYVARTPSNPSLLGGNCSWICTDAGPAPAYWMQLSFKAAQGAFKVTVGKPWKVYVKNDLTSFGLCSVDKFSNGCFKASTIGTMDLAFYFFTDDPNAPARNIVIENLPGSSCTAADYWQ